MYSKNATQINREKQQRSLKTRRIKNGSRTFYPENGQKFKNSEPQSKFTSFYKKIECTAKKVTDQLQNRKMDEFETYQKDLTQIEYLHLQLQG